MADKIFIRDLKVDCVIGCGPDERVKTQRLVVNLTLHLDISACGDSDNLHDTVNYSAVAKRLAALVGRSRCYTLEALSTGIIADVFMTPDCARVEAVTVRIDKPEAFSKLPAVPCVEITRNRSYFSNRRQRRASSIWRADAAAATAAAEAAASTVDPTVDGRVGVVTAYLAIGTNIGDRVANISTAMRLLQTVPADLAVNPSSVAAHSAPFVRLVATSFLYETPPAYVLDQPPFLNGALCVETNLAPLALLDHIKANVEGAMGREKTLRFGPRNIDVDVLLYGPSQAFDLDGGRLVVPHPRLAERDFALGPLRDLCPGLLHPVHHRSITDLLAALPAVHLTRVVPLRSLASPVPGQSSERLLRLGGRTHLVGVLNVTPDSFSDGGQFFAQENSSDGSSRTSSSGGKDTVALAAGRAVEMVSQGADMVDVGGQSTRPGAQLLPAHEEAARVVPVIRALRAALPSIPISIDTFYASVAAAAVEAGADVVNDVSGGAMDAGMLAIVAQLQVRSTLRHCCRGLPLACRIFLHVSFQSHLTLPLAITVPALHTVPPPALLCAGPHRAHAHARHPSDHDRSRPLWAGRLRRRARGRLGGSALRPRGAGRARRRRGYRGHPPLGHHAGPRGGLREAGTAQLRSAAPLRAAGRARLHRGSS